jgi:hypothetical protein
MKRVLPDEDRLTFIWPEDVNEDGISLESFNVHVQRVGKLSYLSRLFSTQRLWVCHNSPTMRILADRKQITRCYLKLNLLAAKKLTKTDCALALLSHLHGVSCLACIRC